MLMCYFGDSLDERCAKQVALMWKFIDDFQV